MCGIAGLIDRRGALSAEALAAAALGMADRLAHRGPDGRGAWTDAAAGVGFGHRRLAVIDLSPAGAQPMTSADGRYVILHNGEAFNFAELRGELEAAGRRFRGASDTEVILEGCAAWGAEATVRRLIGMFAFALWDRRERVLTLARDRLGIKPLYYADLDRRFLFGSELKALAAAPGWAPSLDRDALAGYLRHGYVAAPATIYREARKLPPGHLLTLAPAAPPRLTRYWDMRRVAVEGLAAAARDPLDEADATDRLEALLLDAVRRRMIADVPLGAFLSGGIDSSTVVALMQAASNRPVKTFTIGFREAGYDEAGPAGAVAAHLGTDHTALYVEPGHALDIIPRLAEWFDEPFADASQIPTYLVAELARRQVTVALSGDGGDEVFAGYNRYVWGERLGLLPLSLRRIAAAALRGVPPAAWDRLSAAVPAPWRPARAGDKAHKLAEVLACDGPAALYRRLVSHWPEPEAMVIGGREPKGVLWDDGLAADIPGLAPRMQFLDTVTYLPDDILTKVDRATMAVGLEGRVPLLDHRLVEFAWRLPPRLRLRQGRGKRLLRAVLARYVPNGLVERPKMGFGVPIDRWLRGPLRPWAEDLLAPHRLAADGILAPAPIAAAWRAHLAGRRNLHYPLWTVLMFLAWRRRWPS